MQSSTGDVMAHPIASAVIMRDSPCAFCDIIAGRLPVTIVHEDARVLAFLDLRQFHPGHVLIIPRAHVADIRQADDTTIAAVFTMVARVARAVSTVFGSESLSVWHSIGVDAFQEVPHMHIHVHPRRAADGLLAVYPSAPALPDREQLDAWGELIRAELCRRSPRPLG
jgi:histidine triad (HIT) family protein